MALLACTVWLGSATGSCTGKRSLGRREQPSTRHAAVALQEGWQGSLFLNVTVLGQHEADNMLLFRMSLCTHHQAVPMSRLGTAFLEQPGTAACPLHAVLTDLR